MTKFVKFSPSVKLYLIADSFYKEVKISNGKWNNTVRRLKNVGRNSCKGQLLPTPPPPSALLLFIWLGLLKNNLN